MLKLAVILLLFVFQFQLVHCKIEKQKKKLRHAITKGKRVPLPITLAPGTLLEHNSKSRHETFQFQIEGVIDANENTYFARNAKDGTPVKVKLYGKGSASQMPSWHNRASDFNADYIISWTDQNYDGYGIHVSEWYLNDKDGNPYMKMIQTVGENHFLAQNDKKMPYDLQIFKTVGECNAAISPEDEDAKCFEEGSTMPGWILAKRKHIRNYKIVGFIAEGGFGAVYSGISEETGKTCAIKVFKPSSRAQKSYDEEVESFQKVKGLENVAQMVDHFKSDIGFVVVVDYYNLGDLMNVLFNLNDQTAARIKGGTSSKEYMYSDRVLCDTIHILIDTEVGLQSMHEKLISHTDLKPENVLVRGPRNTIEGKAEDMKEPSKFTAAMGDLGLVEEANAAKAAAEQEKFVRSNGRPPPKAVAFGGMRGTPMYLPPEKKASYPVSSKDVFAFGTMIRDDIMETIQPLNNAYDKSRYKMGERYDTTTSAYEKVYRAGGFFFESKCADTLRQISSQTRSHSPWLRLKDGDIIRKLEKGYKDGMRVTTAWDEMMKHKAVALTDASKKETGGMAGGLFRRSRKRDMFFTPFLNQVAYNEIFKCDKANPLQENTPYIVISSESSKKAGYWTCYPVQTVEKVPSDKFKFTVESTIPTLKKYTINLKDAKCDGFGGVKGSCKVLGSVRAQEKWRTHVVHLLTGGGGRNGRVSATSSTISEMPEGGQDISMRPSNVGGPNDEAHRRDDASIVQV